MEHLPLASVERFVFAVIAAIALLAPPLLGQQDRTAAGSPEAAWSNIQQLVQSLENAVQSKNLHAIHEPSMKIRAPIRSLRQHCNESLCHSDSYFWICGSLCIGASTGANPREPGESISAGSFFTATSLCSHAGQSHKEDA